MVTLIFVTIPKWRGWKYGYDSAGVWGENNDVQNNDRNETLDKTISDLNLKGDVISNLNVLNNTKETSRQDQVYISLQSPSREDNPITAFVKPCFNMIRYSPWMLFNLSSCYISTYFHQYNCFFANSHLNDLKLRHT